MTTHISYQIHNFSPGIRAL